MKNFIEKFVLVASWLVEEQLNAFFANDGCETNYTKLDEWFANVNNVGLVLVLDDI